ncbi:MAG: hypothetical protein ACR2HS_06985, partial [Gammaproteobacteria bacterium]
MQAQTLQNDTQTAIKAAEAAVRAFQGKKGEDALKYQIAMKYLVLAKQADVNAGLMVKQLQEILSKTKDIQTRLEELDIINRSTTVKTTLQEFEKLYLLKQQADQLAVIEILKQQIELEVERNKDNKPENILANLKKLKNEELKSKYSKIEGLIQEIKQPLGDSDPEVLLRRVGELILELEQGFGDQSVDLPEILLEKLRKMKDQLSGFREKLSGIKGRKEQLILEVELLKPQIETKYLQTGNFEGLEELLKALRVKLEEIQGSKQELSSEINRTVGDVAFDSPTIMLAITAIKSANQQILKVKKFNELDKSMLSSLDPLYKQVVNYKKLEESKLNDEEISKYLKEVWLLVKSFPNIEGAQLKTKIGLLNNEIETSNVAIKVREEEIIKELIGINDSLITLGIV